ncbi:unnamed protein product [Citrullus colocynthis]|uniref:Cystatin domain-containing protein n=1 Tax=Citrullus colocynthis TaxID=252529 RepID=A0ABP0YI99_9ROSI
MCSVVLGGYGPCEDPQGPHVKEIAEWAVGKYNEQGHDLTMISVVKCESQVVSGVNYRLTLLAKDNHDNHERFYETVVFEKIWEHYRELVYFKPLMVPGGYVPCQDPKGPLVKEIAKWAVEEYNKQGHCLTLIRVLKCESQVVAGVNYRLVLLAKDDKNCENNYETVVWEKLEGQGRELTYFKLLLTQ